MKLFSTSKTNALPATLPTSPIGVQQCYLDHTDPKRELLKEVISVPSRKAPRGLIFPSSAILTAWEITWVYGETKSLSANGIFAAFLAANREQELKTKLPINMGFQGESLEKIFYSSLTRFMYSC